MDLSKSDDDLKLQRLKQSPNMFNQGEDHVVEDQDGSDERDSGEKRRDERDSSEKRRDSPDARRKRRDSHNSSEKGDDDDDTPGGTPFKTVMAGSAALAGAQFTAAIIACVALIGPQIIVALNPSPKKHLLTVSCCVFTFAATLTASNPSMGLIGLCQATVGFTAVLMVFARGLK
jgi:hypothetical protein